MSYVSRFAAVVSILTSALTFSAAPAAAQSIPYDLVMALENTGSSVIPAGAQARWDMTVTNDGPLASQSATATLSIPTGLSFVSVDGVSGFSSCVYNASESSVTCAVPALPADSVAEAFVTLESASPGVLIVSAAVDSADAQPANNVVNDQVTVNRGADLSAALTAPATIRSGDTLTWNVAVTNAGPNPLSSGYVELPQTPGISDISLPSGCSVSGGGYRCDVGGLTTGASRTFAFSARVSAAGSSTVSLVASAVAGDPLDGNVENNTASASVNVLPGSDLSIAKVRQPATDVPVGGSATFRITPYYTGDAPGQVTVTDDVPAAYEVLGVSAPGYTCSVVGNSVSCVNPGTGAAGSQVSLGDIIIQTRALAVGNPTNTATVRSTAMPAVSDPNPGNNSATDGGRAIVPAEIDLAAAKSGPSPAFITAGQDYPFTLRAANIGNTDYVGTVRITDLVPAGLTITSANAGPWTCATPLPVTGPGTVTCEMTYTTAEPLASGQAAPDLILIGTSNDDGEIRNRMRVDAVNGNLPDLRTGNNETGFGVRGNVVGTAADVFVNKNVNAPSVVVGEPLQFEIEVGNAGNGVATNVTVTDLLDELLNVSESGAEAGIVSYGFVRNAPVGGACGVSATSDRQALLTCEIPEMPICAAGTDCPVIGVTVRPGHNTAARNNIAEVISNDIADPNYANNRDTANYAVEPRVDVTITKTVSPQTIEAGQAATWTLTAINTDNDRSSATNIRIADVLPHDLTVTNITVSGDGVCATRPATNSVTGPGNDQLVCQWPEITNGAQQTVLVSARPGLSWRGRTVVNTATVTNDVIDLDPSNHTASANLDVENPRLDLVGDITVAPSIAPMGDTVAWTVTILNSGPSAAESPSARVTLPAGVRFSGLSGTGTASCAAPAVGTAGGTVQCDWTYLAPGASRTFVINTVAAAKGVHPAVVNVTSAEVTSGNEMNPANNSLTRNVTIRTRVNLNITKAASTPTPGLLEPFTWSITVNNPAGSGLSEAENVRVIDTLPSGTVLNGTPSVSILGGTAATQSCVTSGNTGLLCTFGEISSGARIRIDVPVVANTACAGNPVCAPVGRTNTARVTTDSFDTNPADNQTTNTVNVTTSTISGAVFRDFDANGSRGPNDSGVSGRTVTVTGVSGLGAGISVTTTTGTDGTYAVGSLPAGVYRVSAPWSEAWVKDYAAHSSAGTVTSPSVIDNITLDGASSVTQQNFSGVPEARIGVAKRVSSGVTIANGPQGIYRVSYRFTLRNLGLEPVTPLALVDSLTGAYPKFGTHDAALAAPGTYRVQTVSGTGACARNAAFDGSGNTNLLDGATALAPNASCTVTLTLNFRPVQPLPASANATATWQNDAVLTGQGVYSGQTPATNPYLTHRSVNGSNVDPNGNGIAQDQSSLTPTPFTVTPRIAVQKTIASTSFTGQAQIGDTITYAFDVRNSGNVPLYDVTLTDVNAVVSGGPIPVLNPTGSDTTTFTAVHTLTAQDFTDGKVANRATVSGTAVAGRTVTAASTNETGANADTVLNLGDVSVVKSGTVPVKDHVPGDLVTFGFAVTNNGASALTNVVLSDQMAGITMSATTIPNIPAGATNTAVTGTYALTQADIDRGYVDNAVTVTGAYGQSGGVPFTVTGTDDVRVSLTQSPRIQVLKTGTIAGDPPHAAGADISWDFSVRNAGNVTLTDITLTDPDGGTGARTTIARLDPGQEIASAWTLTRDLTQAEIDAGQAVNQASVSAQTPAATAITDLSGPSWEADAPTVVPVPQAPALLITKTYAGPALTAPRAGEDLEYDIRVENTGNVTLTGLNVTDALPGAAVTGLSATTLAPGAVATATARYALTQGDVDAGTLVNRATATAAAPGVTGPNRATANDEETVTLPAAPAFTVVKTGAPDAIRKAGDTVTWDIVVTNTGNVTLSDVLLTDAGATLSDATTGVLAPGAVVRRTAETVLSQDQIEAGVAENRATGTSVFRAGQPGETTLTVSDEAETSLLPDPQVSLTKTADASALGAPVRPGDTITYAFEVENTGNLRVTDLSLADALPGIVLDAPVLPRLEPGETSAVWTATYAVTQADIDAGRVDNTATVSGTTVEGPTSASDAAAVDLPQASAVTLEKTADISALPSRPAVGDEVLYAFRVTNTGNTTLTDLSLTDTLVGLSLNAPNIPSLAPGEFRNVWTGTYALTQADINAGRVDNTATVSGTAPDGPVSAADAAEANIARAPELAMTKTVSATGLSTPPTSGDIITYVFSAENTGNVTLTDVTLSDPMPGLSLASAPVPELAPGAEVEIGTATYALTQADIEAGFVANTATTTGTHPQGQTSAEDAARLDLTQAPQILTEKTPDLSSVSAPAQVGEEVRWRVYATNTGNVILNGLDIEDAKPGVTVEPETVTAIAPGERVLVATVSYALTQADLDAETVENTVTVRAQSVAGAVSDDASVASGLTSNPALILTKTADTTSLSAHPLAGEVITYGFLIENTGNVTLTAVDLTDALPGVTLSGDVVPSLAPGATISRSGTYALTQADIEAHGVTNAAEATAQHGSVSVSDTASVTTNLPVLPGLALTKTADLSALSTPPQAGDAITYGFAVTNTGNLILTDVTLTDLLDGVDLDAPAIPTLAPGATDTSWTATYALTQADIDAGRVVNTARADATSAYGDVSAPADTTSPLATAPSLQLTKTLDASGLSTPPRAGESVNFSFSVRNTGNVTITDLVLTDPMPGLSLTAPGISALAPDAEEEIGTGVYVLTQSDIEAGFIANTATVTGDFSGDPVTDDASARHDLPRAPSISLEKIADTSGISDPAAAGQALTWDIYATNTGNVILTDLSVADPLPGVSLVSETVSALAPGERARLATASYTVTQADVNAGEVSNTATVSADSTGGPAEDDADAIVALAQSPALALRKTADVSALSNPPAVGDLITYAFEVENTGNVTLTDLVLDEALADVEVRAEDVSPLTPAAVRTVWTATYALTQADIEAGEIVNTATASATFGGAPVSDTATATVPLIRSQEIALVKTAAAEALSTPPQVGDTLPYAFAITNTGNVMLTDIVLTDALDGVDIPVSTIDALAPGESVVLTGSLPLTQTQIDTGTVLNAASVAAESVAGPATSADEVSVPLARDPEISLDKTADVTGLSTPPVPGDVITYAFRVENTGNTTVNGLRLTDALAGAAVEAPEVLALAPGESHAAWTASYTITQADIEAGLVRNAATATGESAGTPVTAEASVMTPLAQQPALSLTKTADVSGLSSPPLPGDRISYAFIVTNIGNVVLTNITLTDDLPGVAVDAAAIPVLNPGETDASWTATYTLTQADIDRGVVDNAATANGDGVSGSVSGTASVSSALASGPAISATKTVDAAGLSNPPVAGDTLRYTVTATNIGNVTLSGVTVDDPLLTLAGGSVTLAPGATTEWTGTYALTQSDVDAMRVLNTAVVSGTFEDDTVSDEASVTADLTALPGLLVEKSADITRLSASPVAGEVIVWSVKVTNVGNVTASDLSVTDAMPGLVLSGGASRLDPGASAVWTGPYALTQADINAGTVENLAVAQAETPAGPVTHEDRETVRLEPVPSIALTKAISPADGAETPLRAGDTVEVVWTVTNTGNITLTGGLLTDAMEGVVFDGELPDIAPGATITVSGRYVLTQADIDAGTIGGPAAVTANGSGMAVRAEAEADLPLTQAPAIALIKTADASGVTTPAEPGQAILYRFVVRNTGNTTLTNVRLTDDMPGLDVNAPVVPVLEPGESHEDWTARRVITEDDFEGARLVNSATATADSPSGESVTDVSGDGEGNDRETIVAIVPPADADLNVTKTASVRQAVAGDTVTYDITVRNAAVFSARDIAVVDRLPAGLVFVPGSGTVDGRAAEPEVRGRSLVWDGLDVPATGEVRVRVQVRVANADFGDLTNTAWATDQTGERVSNIAEATITVEAEHVFDCTDIFGKVFHDRNGDGQQQPGEPGVAGVELRTLDGLVITTDGEGRYAVPCAATPAAHGSNVLIKLDARTLPAGFVLNGDASALVRATPGKAAKLNFVLDKAREITVKVSRVAVDSPEFRSGVATAFSAMRGEAATVSLVWDRSAGESQAQVRAGLRAVTNIIKAEARRAGVEITVRTGSIQ